MANETVKMRCAEPLGRRKLRAAKWSSGEGGKPSWIGGTQTAQWQPEKGMGAGSLGQLGPGITPRASAARGWHGCRERVPFYQALHRLRQPAAGAWGSCAIGPCQAEPWARAQAAAGAGPPAVMPAIGQAGGPRPARKAPEVQNKRPLGCRAGRRSAAKQKARAEAGDDVG